MLDLLREIGQTLRNNKLRTSLTGLAVAWGVFMLIILLGAVRGVVNSFNDFMSADNSNTVSIWGGRTSMPYKGFKDGRWIELKDGDIEVLEHENRNVNKVTAFASVDTAKISTPRDYIGDGFMCVFPDVAETDHLTMLHGRFINDRDIAESRRVMVLHEKNARLLFGDDTKAVGQTVKSMGLAWTVVGVYTHEWRSQSYTPYTTYKALTGDDDGVWQLQATVEGMKTLDDADKVDKAIHTTLAKQHQFHPDDANAIWTWNRFASYLNNLKGFGYLNIAMWVIGIFTLLSGIVGVSNIMFVSVRERTHEIGIRRAIGAKPRSILTQVLSESVAITALFGYIGIFFGMVVLEIINIFFGNMEGFKHPSVDISIAIQVTIALIIAGALAGLFPALKAIKVKPVEALRDE